MVFPVLIPLFLLALVGLGWAVDSGLNSGASARGVTVAGTDVGGLDRDELEAVLVDVAAGYAETPVIVRTADGEVTTTAGVVGLELDPMATADNVMEIGRGNVFGRPFSWLAGVFGSRSATTAVRLGEGDPAELEAVVNAGQPEPIEPTLTVEDGLIVVVPGQSVQTFDLSNIRDDVVAAASAGDSPIVVEAGSLELNPSMSDEEAQVFADEYNALTADGIIVSAVGDDAAFDAASLRSWMRFAETEDGFEYTLDPDATKASLTERYGEPELPDENVIEVIDGRPRLVGFVATRCCDIDSAERIERALRDGRDRVALVLEAVDKSEDELLREFGIIDLVGEATTPYDCCQSRVTNIQLFADLMTGVVLQPGESISLNDHVGRRTTEKGFVPAGVISRGELSSDVGGGISQFATTIFQAMFYGGIDIDKYQAHTLWFTRYLDFAGRRGIESTISFPEPDVQFTNNTPYPLLIWPTYTDTSLTVSLYSTTWSEVDVLEQREYFSGQCTVIETDRVRRYEDGTEEIDSFRAFYQPRDGIGCDGKPTNPTPTPVPTPTPEGGGNGDGGGNNDGGGGNNDDGGNNNNDGGGNNNDDGGGGNNDGGGNNNDGGGNNNDGGGNNNRRRRRHRWRRNRRRRRHRWRRNRRRRRHRWRRNRRRRRHRWRRNRRWRRGRRVGRLGALIASSTAVSR